MAINKEGVAKALQAANKESGITLTKPETITVVNNLIDTIIELSKTDKVSLAGLGAFEVVEREARKGRNPQTGEEIEVAAKKVPKFKFAKGFKDEVKG